jgi:hypothetical protein
MEIRGVLERTAAPLAGVSAGLFAGLSKTRGKRFFHPRGVALDGTITFRPTSFALPLDGTHPAVARLSRGIGLPEVSPDVLGLAVKVPALGQDFLLATSGSNPVTRHMLLPATGFFRMPYSSILPYELRGDLVVFGARADTSLHDSTGQEMDDLVSHAVAGHLRFDLTVARPGESGDAVFASLVLESRHENEVKFTPWNSHSELRPAGALNRLRRETYESSQSARPASGDDVAADTTA